MCGYPGNHSACLITPIDTLLSLNQRGADVALEIQPQTSKHQFQYNNKVVLFSV